MSQNYAIHARDLTRRFGDFVAVDRMNLAVPQGSIYGYLGLNGAGKSTTIKMLTGLLQPTEGSATVAGHDVVTAPEAVRSIIGLVGDEGGDSCPSWTALEYVGYFARLRGLAKARERTTHVLDLVGLDPAFRGRVIGSYSTGMKRRVEVARALLSEPRVLFLDEPTRGLDLPAKREMWEMLRDLVRERGVTIFLSSHEVPEIQALCEDISVIARGKMTYSGRASELGKTPEEFEASLIRLLRGEPRRTTFERVAPRA
ncbi:MAG TPA: ABC transporter ATP-binding protein [Candidatus Thermoplasmatota archaeon]|nr:ABC transporter ATP-binding protein [Candidatus Thermoplasmatota archaeon]